MPAFTRCLLLVAVAFAMATAGIPIEAKNLGKPSRCCLLMKQDGCDQKPVKSTEQAQCCVACALCLALPPESTAMLVHASTDEEDFLSLRVRAQARAHQPEVPPPRSMRA